MKLDTFLVQYRIKKSDEQKAELLKSHIVKNYVPIEQKKNSVDKIIEHSYYSDKKESKNYFHSLDKYIYTCMEMLSLYTDIEVYTDKYDEFLKTFDKINEIRLFDLFLKTADQREMKEYNMVLEMEIMDTVERNR